MAITAVLIYAGHNRLRYLIDSTEDGESISLESDGGATPDMQTDSLAGPLKQIFKVKDQGYGVIPVGGITTAAQAVALLQGDLNSGVPVPFGEEMVTAITRITGRTGGAPWTVVGVRGPSDLATPGLTITNKTGGAASCYLDIEVPGAIGA